MAHRGSRHSRASCSLFSDMVKGKAGKTVEILLVVLSSLLALSHTAELLQNGDFESLDHWDCYNIHCELTTTSHTRQHAIKASNRNHDYEGPQQSFNVTRNFLYAVQAYVKLLDNGYGKIGQDFKLQMDFIYNDGSHHYKTVALHRYLRSDQGWVLLQGDFKAPDHAMQRASMRIQGPDPGVSFLVDSASVTNIWRGQAYAWREHADDVINTTRKSDIHVRVTTSGHVNKNDVQIQVLQTKKSFPVGTAVNAWRYQSSELYRDFIHRHFIWAVPESSLKWKHVEPEQGHYNYHLPLNMINELKQHGIEIRGHNLIWSTDQNVMDWVKQFSGDHLRSVVRDHIIKTMNKTHGLLEQWDVNNENLHGFWFQERLQDFSYEQEPFSIAHREDPNVKLFLNDYQVVAHGESTGAYVAQAERLKAANVGLYGLGAQCHFYVEEKPDPILIRHRLDALAKTGLPVWITEMNVVAADESTRADYLETALRAMYGHPAVEGILLWGFWDQQHSRGPHAALTKGDNMELTEAGRRFLDLFENQWMTDETRALYQSGDQFTVRGFHGDYELRVHYQGRELTELRKMFTLGKSDTTVNVNVHV